MRPVPLLFSVTALGVFSAFANVSAAASYAPLHNKSMGIDTCLAVGEDKSRVFFAPCNGSREQNWTVSAHNGGHYFIHNESSETQCLRTLSNGRTVTLGACSGDGYTSMRLWTVKHNLDASITLRNKYSLDQGRKETLNADAANSTPSMSVPHVEDAAHWTYSGEIPSPKRPLLGHKKALVMATHYNDSLPANPNLIHDAVLGEGDYRTSLKNYLRLASHGKLTLDGKFLSNINLGERPATCDSSMILDRARSAARAQGVEPDEYDFLMVDISRSSNCRWEGLAQTPGNWILSNGVGHKYWMWSHEFGHNLGFLHSSTLQDCPISDGVVRLNSQCRKGGGADAADTMGGGGERMYPAHYQLFTGSLEDSDVPVIKKPGTYKLTPLWQSGGAQGYRLYRSDGSTLVLEYRQPQPVFEEWPVDSPFVNGVTVREVRYSGNTVAHTLVDATPASTSGMKDAPLMPGYSLHDELSGKLITVLSADNNSTVIKVEDRATLD
ncbi:MULTISPECIES: hypothetical protein [Pseudomonas]|uniref:hypothetical protein n=1 Tax=Pseudomonas TaxID=286 RepID=UPI0022349EFC|nr:hypothetical protein [Pseudomonas sp. B21-059]UZE34439.1 hypothetical protein LOY69_27730 [Pseudomonas sp. B21-059]